MKRNTKTNQENGPSSSGKSDFSLKDIFFQMVEGFVKNFFEHLQDGVVNKIREIIQDIKRSATITLLIVFGIIFLFIGLANVIDVVIGFKGIGFLCIGFIVMFIGFFLNVLTRRS